MKLTARRVNPFVLPTALALIAATSAFAGDGWKSTLELEKERIKAPGGADFWSDSAALVIGHREGANQFDFKIEEDKDHDKAAATGDEIEAQFERYFGKISGFEPSLRVGIGENIQNGNGSSFSFYTIQPKISYDLGNGVEPYVSVRYRQRFDNTDWHTSTWYLGTAFAMPNGWQLEPSLFHKAGVETSNGFKLEITRKL
jgi:hypothetical protein